MSRTALRTGTARFAIERDGETVILVPSAGPRGLGCQPKDGPSDALRERGQPPVKNVVVDFQMADCFGTMALNLFLRLWKNVRDRDGQMVLCNLSHHTAEMLYATNLDSMWTICPTRAEALEVVKA
jgi:anti-anti-sigma factor